MKTYLRRINDTVLFEASNDRGHKVRIEGSREIGGEDSAPFPTELLLMSQASCTAIDVVELLRKMRQSLIHIEIESQGERIPGAIPPVFDTIHLHYRLFGDVQPEKADSAISKSIQKYCTVSKMIDQVSKITYSFEILPVEE